MTDGTTERCHPPGHQFRKLVRPGFIAVVSILLFLIVMPELVGGRRFSVCIALVFGWVGFLQRTLPQVSWNWDIFGMGLLCSAAVLFLAHGLLSWMTTRICSARNLAWEWPWKWSACGFVALGSFFLVGMSVGGAMHQVGWLINSEEPWYERKRGSREDHYRMREVEMGFRLALSEDDTVEAVRESMTKSESEVRNGLMNQKSSWQSFHLLFVVGKEGKVEGLIIFPRDATNRAKIGGRYFSENDNREIQAKELPGKIRELHGKLVSF